ncbi:MAG: S8 family serine peptidase [Muribaculaceae bacterium]|nr:S8 family serine peptidase [Muribaculaceae bacterium]
MKKIFFGKGANGHEPFWQPWGLMGCLGRLLLFLLLLVLLMALLSLFRSCDHGSGDQLADANWPEEFQRPGNEYVQPRGQDNGNSTPSDPQWNRPIDGGEDVGLPSPDENVLPPFEEMEPEPNPDNDGATQVYPNLLYVILDSDVNDEAFKAFAAKFTQQYPEPDHKIEWYNSSAKTAVLSVPDEKRMEICRKLPSQIPEVKFLVVPVEVMVQAEGVTPNDPIFRYPNYAWFFTPIQAQEAWAVTQGSDDVVVGIVDSFMDLNHPELSRDRVLYPYEIYTGSSNVAPVGRCPIEVASHGTLVTSIAVGAANNNAGSSGIAPKCKFIPVSIGKAINTITMVEGLLYCIYHGADVVNLSVGMQFNPDMVRRMSINDQIAFSQQFGLPTEKMWDYVFKLAEDRDVTIVWAAGNDNVFTAMDVSKRNDNTIKVSAVDRNLRKADFSNFGNFRQNNIYESTISAPGVDIFGATPGNTYVAWPGTSFSAPIITGTVALIKSVNPDLKTSQIISILKETGKPVSGAPEIGNLVQIKDAVLKAKSTAPATDRASQSSGNNQNDRQSDAQSGNSRQTRTDRRS